MRCFDDPQSITTDGTQPQIYDCDALTMQQWHVPTNRVTTYGRVPS
ncbi:protein of unknown function [Agreia sp. COWG]|nr:protein of unknown function [Agreia sp. COWG]